VPPPAGRGEAVRRLAEGVRIDAARERLRATIQPRDDHGDAS